MTNNVKLGIFIIILSTLFFATMDGVSRYLADNYNVFVINMIRSQDNDLNTILVVGHNPSMHEVYEYLTSDSITNFPTCGFAEVSFTEDLSKSLEGVAKCDLFVNPNKEL